MAMVKVSVLLIGIFIGLVFGNWVDGFEEILSFNETAMSFLDSEHMEAFGASKAVGASNVLMVGLTLIQGAGAKGAGTFFLLYILFFFFFLSLISFPAVLWSLVHINCLVVFLK